MIPVRCTIVRPPLGYVLLGSEPALQTVLTSEQTRLTNEIIKAVIKEAAFTTGIQIGLMFVPVIGQAIAGLLALMNMILGQIYQRQIQQVIANTMDAIKKRSNAAQARVEAAGAVVVQEEFPAVAAALMKGQPIGDLWSRALKTPEKIVRQAGAAVHTIIVNPQAQMKFLTTALSPVGIARLAVKDVLKVATFGAKRLEVAQVVKPGTLTTALNKAQNTVDDVMFSAQKLTNPLTTVQEGTGLTFKYGSAVVAASMDATGNHAGAEATRKIGNEVHYASQEMMTALTPTGGYNLFSGREGYLAARDACGHMQARAFASIDASANEAIVTLQSPEGRKNTRIALGKALSQDPSFQAQLQELQALEAQKLQPLQQGQDLLTSAAGPPSSGFKTVLGVAAAGAAAFFIAR